MAKATFVFTEATPSSPTTVVSSAPVQGAASYLPAGVAGPFGDYQALTAIFEVPTNSTGGALAVTLQTSTDDGLTWYDRVSLPSIASAAPAAIYSATMSLASNTTAPTQVGKNAAPALAANKTVGGAFGDRARLVLTGGTGTTSSINVTVRLMAQRQESNR